MATVEAKLPINPDVITDALLADDRHLVAAIGGKARVTVRGEAGLLITGVPIPTMNGVLTIRPSASLADVSGLLDIAAKADVPYGLMARPGFDPRLMELARSRGMHEDEPIPLMAMPRDVRRARRAAHHSQLRIRVLDPDEAGVHAAIAAEAFEAPVDVFETLIRPSLMRRPGHRAYVGAVDGEDVTTVFSMLEGDHVGIFDVATPARHRGRGYGAAITAQAVLDGFESGASYAFLQSSPMGLKIYERLGFSTLETWRVYVSGFPSRS